MSGTSNSNDRRMSDSKDGRTSTPYDLRPKARQDYTEPDRRKRPVPSTELDFDEASLVPNDTASNVGSSDLPGLIPLTGSGLPSTAAYKQEANQRIADLIDELNGRLAPLGTFIKISDFNNLKNTVFEIIDCAYDSAQAKANEATYLRRALSKALDDTRVLQCQLRAHQAALGEFERAQGLIDSRIDADWVVIDRSECGSVMSMRYSGM
jgi:hypothetical protein